MGGNSATRRVLVGLTVVFLLTGCASSASPKSSATTSASAAAAATPTVTSMSAPTPLATPTSGRGTEPPPTLGAVVTTLDVVFSDSTPTESWTPPTMDVFAPAGAHALPLVIIFPPHNLTSTDYPVHHQMAEAIAAKGAVVAVANWSQTAGGTESPAAVATITAGGRSVAACAVTYAVEHAAVYGADPSRLVLVGQFYGANIASLVALAPAQPLPGCRAGTTKWAATGAVGWDGDWLAQIDTWDAFGADAAKAVAALSPWALASSAPKVPMTFATSDFAAKDTRRCETAAVPWLAWRDPSGAMRARLKSVGALVDGCVDSVGSAKAMAAELEAHGFRTSLVHLTDADSTESLLAPADLSRMVDAVITLTRAPASSGQIDRKLQPRMRIGGRDVPSRRAPEVPR